MIVNCNGKILANIANIYWALTMRYVLRLTIVVWISVILKKLRLAQVKEPA